MNSEMNKGETIPTLEQMVEGIVMPQQVADEVECAEELGLESWREQRLADLRFAYDFLNEHRALLAHGPTFPYSVIVNARDHVDREITKLYREELGIK